MYVFIYIYIYYIYIYIYIHILYKHVHVYAYSGRLRNASASLNFSVLLSQHLHKPLHAKKIINAFMNAVRECVLFEKNIKI